MNELRILIAAVVLALTMTGLNATSSNADDLPACQNVAPDAPPETLVINPAAEGIPEAVSSYLGVWDGPIGAISMRAILVQSVTDTQITFWRFNALSGNVLGTSSWKKYTFELKDGIAYYGERGRIYIDSKGKLVDETNGTFPVAVSGLTTGDPPRLTFIYTRCALS